MDDGAYQEPLHLIINDGSYGGPGVTVLLNLSKIYQIHCFTHQIHCSPVKNMSKKCRVLAVPESVFSPYSVTVQGVLLPPSLNCSLLGCVAATLIPLCILLGCVAATLIPLRILLGCVAATLIALLSFGCVAATLIACTLWGVLLPPLFYPRVHPTTFSPISCQRLCILSWTT